MLITPFTSVGNLSFSDSRQTIRKKLSEPFDAGVHEFEGLKEYYDYFKLSDLKVGYDTNEVVNFFEFYEPKPVFNGIDLLTETFDKLIEMFTEMDPEFENNFGEFTTYKYGIGGIIDYSADEDLACAESIIIFRQGYYDKLDEYKASFQ
jgi:hypothetical protein